MGRSLPSFSWAVSSLPQSIFPSDLSRLAAKPQSPLIPALAAAGGPSLCKSLVRVVWGLPAHRGTGRSGTQARSSWGGPFAGSTALNADPALFRGPVLKAISPRLQAASRDTWPFQKLPTGADRTSASPRVPRRARVSGSDHKKPRGAHHYHYVLPRMESGSRPVQFPPVLFQDLGETEEDTGVSEQGKKGQQMTIRKHPTPSWGADRPSQRGKAPSGF